MKFGIFYQHQSPRPWNDGAEEGTERQKQDAKLCGRTPPRSP